ncbi:MAG TPA: hypothetical protein VJO34_15300 [Methylomirabilota bacterium]|nr:hypothetical protein [Methylomirabilota bacterium]
MVKRSAVDEAVSTCLLRLERQLDNRSAPLDDLATVPPEILAAALKRLARARPDETFLLCESLLESGNPTLLITTIELLGAIPQERALNLLAPFASSTDQDGRLRSAARRSLYRLSQAGISLKSTSAPSRPFFARAEERLARGWTSGVDGTGSRALWVLFEDGRGGLLLLELLINDQVGILECAGEGISKKQLAQQLQAIKTSQKLLWAECPPERAVMAVREALAVHDAAKTAPPDNFARWRPLFTKAGVKREDVKSEEQEKDPTLLDHSAELLEIPELTGWFVDPEDVQSEGIELLQARESRLVVNDQIKAEREASIVDRVIERIFTDRIREVWAKRLHVMAWLFNETGRGRQGAIASATADALTDSGKFPRHIPFVRTLIQRGLDLATEVTLGRAKREEVSRAPRRREA